MGQNYNLIKDEDKKIPKKWSKWAQIAKNQNFQSGQNSKIFYKNITIDFGHLGSRGMLYS